MNFGTTEILLIVAVLFLLFGATRLPQLAKSLGQSRKAFKEGMREAEEEEANADSVQSSSEGCGTADHSNERRGSDGRNAASRRGKATVKEVYKENRK